MLCFYGNLSYFVENDVKCHVLNVVSESKAVDSSGSIPRQQFCLTYLLIYYAVRFLFVSYCNTNTVAINTGNKRDTRVVRN